MQTRPDVCNGRLFQLLLDVINRYLIIHRRASFVNAVSVF